MSGVVTIWALLGRSPTVIENCALCCTVYNNPQHSSPGPQTTACLFVKRAQNPHLALEFSSHTGGPL